MLNVLVLLERQRTKQLAVAMLVVGLLVFVYGAIGVYASGLGGYISEKLISSGTANSALVIDRFGAGNTNLDVVMGPRVTSLEAANIFMDGAGTHATLSGSLTSLNGFPTSNVWFEWGYSTAYGNTTPVQVAAATGVYTATIDHYIATNQVFFRFAGQTDGINYSTGSFILTDLSGPGAIIPILPVILMVFVAEILFYMLYVVEHVKNPITQVIILAVLIYIGIALIPGIQQLLNSIF